MPYRAPIAEYRFLLERILGFRAVAASIRFSDANPEMVDAILTGAARLSETTLAPLNRQGDLHPARLENGVVRTSPGFAEGFRAMAAGGWIGMSANPAYGGLGLPTTLNACVAEMMSSACLALQLNPMLTQGQIEALDHHASDAIKALYLPKLISGEWNGTMNLTEPQAGSDVGALRTRAEPLVDGSHAITGQKVYITWGDADFMANTCHLVLARLPDAAPGVKGISLFMVPKFLPDADGNPGARNSLHVISLEHKMGIHGSPTCVMQFDAAKGWLVGGAHQGMAAMFTMMNNARLGVGMQGVAQAEAAFQLALTYANDRKQGKTPLGPGAIIDHADVRRMLAEMKAEVFAARAICLACAMANDMAAVTDDAAWLARAALLTPIAKAYGTDTGHHVAQLGVQVHGGTGFIEQTGAAQYARDVRITQIYEGTNGIQAMDLVGRKMLDGGDAALAVIDDMQRAVQHARPALADLAAPMWSAIDALHEATEDLLAQPINDRFAGAVPYQRAFARVLGCHYHLLAAMADPAREPLARFAIRRLLPEHAALLAQTREGAAGLYDLTPTALAL